MSDPTWSQTVTLLHFAGSDGSTTFTDSSPAAKTYTATSTAQIDTGQSKWGGSSLQLPLYTDHGYISTTTAVADFRFGTGDFTVECWIKTVASECAILDFFSISNSGWQLFVNFDGDLEWWADEEAYLTGTGTAVNTGSWVHVAACRVGSTLRLFVDGAQVASRTDSTNYSHAVTVFAIGAKVFERDSYFDFVGHIDDVRIKKGAGIYTGAFTPPAAEFEHGDGSLGRVEVASPIGPVEVLGLGAVAAARISDGGPLGAPAALIAGVHARSEVPEILGSTLSLGRVTVAGTATASSPLGPVLLVGLHDFTQLLGDQVDRYLMELATPSGPVRMPISSWQATLRSGAGSNYAQCVVPAVQGLVDALQAATEFTIYRTASLAAGGTIEYEMVRCPLEQLSLDQGSSRHTATIAGYFAALTSDGPAPTATDRTLMDVRSVSISEGGARVRCSIDWLLRPGQRAFHGDLEINVTFINYYGTGGDHYMDVGSYAG